MLLALLLQLALPFLTVQQATARPDVGAAQDRGAAFVICTGAGLVWVRPDGVPANDGGDGDGEDGVAFHCPACFAKQLASPALLAASLVVLPPSHRTVSTGRPAPVAAPLAASAPPLPARGPPVQG